jgi:flavin-dependent dehydrogenase
MRKRCDVCVVGGGPAGSALAILLSRQGARVALVEKTGFAALRPGEHLPPQACAAVRALASAPQRFQSMCIESPGILSRWAARAPQFKPYLRNPDGFGLHLSRRQFDQALFRQAEHAGAAVYEKAMLADATRNRCGWDLSLRTPSGVLSLRARFVADASGRTSVFARRQGARWNVFGHLIATCAWLRPAEPGPADDLCLHVEACKHGWWSIAATPQGEIVATFYGSAEMKRQMGMDTIQWWCWGLKSAPAIHNLLARIAAGLDEVAIYPAFPRLLRDMHGPDWFAVGDAAAAHDPLSGHGVLYAFEAAFRAAEMVASDLPLDRIAPIYQEAIEGRFVRHLEKRREAYAEAAPRFPRSPFWTAMSEAQPSSFFREPL